MDFVALFSTVVNFTNLCLIYDGAILETVFSFQIA